MPEWMFLAPLALTIFGFSTSSASSERFSAGGEAGPASGFGALAAFFGAWWQLERLPQLKCRRQPNQSPSRAWPERRPWSLVLEQLSAF